MAETIKIGGELESVATGGIVAAASAIKDKTKNKTQEQVNAETDETLAAHSSAISGFEGGNFVTLVATDADADIAAVFTRLSVTPAVNTIYRIANWKYDATTKYNTAYYSEYAANGTTIADLVPISVENKGIDDVPTAESENLVKSGGVQNELALGAVYDVSTKNPTAGPNNDGKWGSLSALLSDANLSTLIPTAWRKGGMSIRFVSSSDNKYVQYRLMSDEFTTDATQWQGVDSEITAGSKNLAESGAVKEALSPLENKTEKISYNRTGIGEDSFKITNDEETETIFEATDDGVDAKNLKSNGKDVATEEQVYPIKNKTDKITKTRLSNFENKIQITDDEGNEVVEINDDYVDCKNLKSNGKDVATEELLETKQDLIPNLSQETNHDTESSEILITDDDDLIARLNKKGFATKSFLNMEGNIFDSNFLKLLFRNWICVGDSVTHGFISDYPNVTWKGYYVKKVSTPRFISQLSGIQTLNAGHGSYSARDWWENICQTLDYSNADIITIELGYNRGFTDTLNIDVEPYDNYTDYADTNTGCMCKIIEYIQEQNSDAYIMIIIPPNLPSWDCDVLYQIAERYNLKTINLKDNSFIDLQDEKFHGFLNQQKQQANELDFYHFNAMGYLFKAKLILHLLEKIIYDDFENILLKTEKRWCNTANELYGYNQDGEIILSDMTTESNRTI